MVDVNSNRNIIYLNILNHSFKLNVYFFIYFSHGYLSEFKDF